MASAPARQPTARLHEEISSNIHQLAHHAASAAQFMQHVPHVSQWDCDSGIPRPSFCTDLKYIYRRHRFLHRKQFQALIATLSKFDSFEIHARNIQFDTGYDLWRLERLTWTFAQVVRYTSEGLQEAQQSAKWRRKRMTREFCAALDGFLKIQVEWLEELGVSRGGTVDLMQERSRTERLEILLGSEVVQQDVRLRRIARVWQHECYLGPVPAARLLEATSETLARRVTNGATPI